MEEDKYIKIKRSELEKFLKERAQEYIDEKLEERLEKELSKQSRVHEREIAHMEAAHKKLLENKKILINQSAEDVDLPYKSKQSYDEESTTDDWLVTYADAITLILVLFVLLFSIAKVDQEKFEELKMSINQNLLQKEEDGAFEKLKDDFLRIIQEFNISNSAVVTMEESGLKIELSSALVYDLGSADLKPEMEPALNKIVQSLKSFKFTGYVIEVEGHTDNIPINTPRYPSNWELSTSRATNIVRYFIENGIDPVKLRAAGYSDSRPKVPNLDEEGEPIPENQAKNRRVVIYVKRL